METLSPRPVKATSCTKFNNQSTPCSPSPSRDSTPRDAETHPPGGSVAKASSFIQFSSQYSTPQPSTPQPVYSHHSTRFITNGPVYHKDEFQRNTPSPTLSSLPTFTEPLLLLFSTLLILLLTLLSYFYTISCALLPIVSTSSKLLKTSVGRATGLLKNGVEGVGVGLGGAAKLVLKGVGAGVDYLNRNQTQATTRSSIPPRPPSRASRPPSRPPSRNASRPPSRPPSRPASAGIPNLGPTTHLNLASQYVSGVRQGWHPE